MNSKTLDSFDFRGKRVLIRIDINSEIRRGKVTLSDRVIQHAKTIKELLHKQARVVVLAHQGRPGEKDCISLKQHAALLRRYVKITFVPDIIGRKARKHIASLQPGEALLLENVRFLKEESAPSADNALVKALAPLFDYYVADALSILHREQTSVTEFPKQIPSCIGRVLEEELRNIEKLNLKECLYILAGAKPEDNMRLLQKARNILTCGIFGQLCLIAKGNNLGAQNAFLEKDMRYIPQLKKVAGYARTPLDLAVKVQGKRRDLPLREFPSQYEIFDIGPATIKEYVNEIQFAETIFMRGTAGYCEEEQFQKGTKALFDAIEKSKAFSVLSGGHTITAMRTLKVDRKKIGYISLSGGALVRYMAGKTLPGLEVLKDV